MPIRKMKEFLDREGVKYLTIWHSPAYTMSEIAHLAHLPGHMVAKTVMVRVDGNLAMAVVPSPRKVDLAELKEAIGAEEVVLAAESEFERVFAGCELGAMPPFGNLYDLDVYVAPELADCKEIAFNAGTHSELMKLSFADFERLVKPRILSFASNV